MELLFELWAQVHAKGKYDSIKDGETKLFQVFFEHTKSKGKEGDASLLKAWEQIRSIYQRLREWYEDDELYHLVGYLMARRKSPKEIKNLLPPLENDKEPSDHHQSKKDFRDRLGQEIKTPLKDLNLSELSYGSDNDLIRDILLLFNLQTLIKGKSKQRFRFDRFFEENWTSIEHIHAQNPQGKDPEEEVKELMEFLKQLMEGKEASTGDEEEVQKLKQLYESLEKLAGEKTPAWDEPINDGKELISEIKDRFDNLALLSSKANSSLNNDPFLDKREAIISLDTSGQFMPICTRNVFTKYYTPKPRQMEFWDLEDRKRYLQTITSTLADFLPQAESTNK